jgi:hypothetical protein
MINICGSKQCWVLTLHTLLHAGFWHDTGTELRAPHQPYDLLSDGFQMSDIIHKHHLVFCSFGIPPTGLAEYLHERKGPLSMHCIARLWRLHFLNILAASKGNKYDEAHMLQRSLMCRLTGYYTGEPMITDNASSTGTQEPTRQHRRQILRHNTAHLQFSKEYVAPIGKHRLRSNLCLK